jgi:hypothetical protein
MNLGGEDVDFEADFMLRLATAKHITVTVKTRTISTFGHRDRMTAAAIR